MHPKILRLLWRDRRIWSHLGWRDLKAQYARTGIGPWWSTATLLASIVGTSVAVQLISNGEFKEIIPRLAIGLSIWTFWSMCLIDGTNMFDSEKSLLLNTTIGEVVLAARIVWRNILIFLHCSIVVLLAIMISGGGVSINLVWLIALLLFAGPLLILFVIVCGLLTIWKRDLKSILPAIIQIGFFVTPILWTAPRGGHGYLMIDLNPIAWHILFVREAILEGTFRGDMLIRLGLLTTVSLSTASFIGSRLQLVRKYL